MMGIYGSLFALAFRHEQEGFLPEPSMPREYAGRHLQAYGDGSFGAYGAGEGF
jgi:hypothetical protein